jgi:hypothetical protein
MTSSRGYLPRGAGDAPVSAFGLNAAVIGNAMTASLNQQTLAKL